MGDIWSWRYRWLGAILVYQHGLHTQNGEYFPTCDNCCCFGVPYALISLILNLISFIGKPIYLQIPLIWVALISYNKVL